MSEADKDEVIRDVLSKPEKAYYKMMEEHEEEYRKVNVYVTDISDGLYKFVDHEDISIDGQISICRYLTGDVSLLMYRMMHELWSCVIYIKPCVRMIIPIIFDLDYACAIHPWCVETKSPTMTDAWIWMHAATQRISDLVWDNKQWFFCDRCDRCVVTNFEHWDKEKMRRNARDVEGRALIRSATVNNKAYFRITGKANALINYRSDSADEE